MDHGVAADLSTDRILPSNPAEPIVPGRKTNRRSFFGIAVAAPALLVAARVACANEGDDNWNDGELVERNFHDIQRHENDHVEFLVKALGKYARPKPTFKNLKQPNRRQFKQTSQALENTGVGAYLGAAPKIHSSAYLAAAGSIALIEARHAGWLNTLLGERITRNVYGQENSFETSLTDEQVAALASPFVASLNGGAPLEYSDTPSPENDIAILNFALALEYLEAEFYNTNVPIFFA